MAPLDPSRRRSCQVRFRSSRIRVQPRSHRCPPSHLRHRASDDKLQCLLVPQAFSSISPSHAKPSRFLPSHMKHATFFSPTYEALAQRPQSRELFHES